MHFNQLRKQLKLHKVPKKKKMKSTVELILETFPPFRFQILEKTSCGGAVPSSAQLKLETSRKYLKLATSRLELATH